MEAVMEAGAALGAAQMEAVIVAAMEAAVLVAVKQMRRERALRLCIAARRVRST
jgi:hypothetical protein